MRTTTDRWGPEPAADLRHAATVVEELVLDIDRALADVPFTCPAAESFRRRSRHRAQRIEIVGRELRALAAAIEGLAAEGGRP